MWSLVVFAAWLCVTGILCWLAVRTGWAVAAPAAVRSVADRYYLRIRTGIGGPTWWTGLVAAAGLVIAGLGASMLLLSALGRLVAQAQHAVDVPVYHFFQDREHQLSWWTHANLGLTQMGNSHPDVAIAALSAITFTIVRTSRRWVPLVTFPVAYSTEKYPQHWLALLVHRGHPPTTVGTWPSGGCARVILVYGLIAYFLLHELQRRQRATRSVRIAVWTVVTFVAATEAYTRVYLLRHWLTDVLPGGLLFGALLLATWTTAAWLMDREVPQVPTELMPPAAIRSEVRD